MGYHLVSPHHPASPRLLQRKSSIWKNTFQTSGGAGRSMQWTATPERKNDPGGISTNRRRNSGRYCRPHQFWNFGLADRMRDHAACFGSARIAPATVLGPGVYTQVYTGAESSGHSGPRAPRRLRSKTMSIGRICPVLSSTYDLPSPQPLKLFANETLYQLSYTPNMINLRKLHGDLREQDRCLSIPYKRMEPTAPLSAAPAGFSAASRMFRV
jgi:hypothetical protein